MLRTNPKSGKPARLNLVFANGAQLRLVARAAALDNRHVSQYILDRALKAAMADLQMKLPGAEAPQAVNAPLVPLIDQRAAAH